MFSRLLVNAGGSSITTSYCKPSLLHCFSASNAFRLENVQKAVTGYKEINLRGMKLIKPGGFLVTSSCTNLVSPDLFLQTIHNAAKDAKRTLRQVTFKAQSSDHPIIWGMENTNYLKFLIVQVI